MVAAGKRDAEEELGLPAGFRFHPTDEELVVHYLCSKVAGRPLPVSIIAEVDLYKFDPWDLPERALFGHKEWYFFTPRDRKYPNGSRPNRAAGKGYWKATGADKPVSRNGCGGGSQQPPLGIKKALVFYNGKAPRGVKTDWIMHEYRLVAGGRKAGNQRLDDWVLCRLYNKKNNWKASGGRQEEPVEVSPPHTIGTPESNVEEIYPPFDVKMEMPNWNEDDDWFTGLNIGDLEPSVLASFGTMPPITAEMTSQDYLFGNMSSSPHRTMDMSLY